ncbi:hypothetical protein MKW98_024216 [Papaver atlanticum]|uniref:Uncharacterized protein n=1 Tax=Papaver atlanticum TaxID=357466 RepID=A0AAD4T0F8_9MAGN|nr:hypothetical protein MKW98_024216 [Papaver atlanticum]
METTQVECREKEAAKVASDNTSTSRRNTSMIANEMRRLFLYYFNIPKACYLVEGVIFSLALVEYGVLFLLMTYLTSVFKYSPVRAAATVNIFAFISGILAIFAELCKLRVGCYLMLQFNCIFYILALVVLLKNFTPKSIKTLHGSLFLLAVGHGVFLSTCIEEFLKAQMKQATRVSNKDDEKRDDIRSTISMMRAKIVGFEDEDDHSEHLPKAGNIESALHRNYLSGITRTSLRSAAPICFAFLMYGIVYSTGETFFQDLAGSANTSSMGNANVYIMMLQSIAKTSRFFIDHLVYRVLSRRSRTGTLGTLIRMGLGMFFSIGTCTIARYTEVARLTSVENKTNIGVFFFIPQFIALGFVTGLAGEGLIVFFKNEYSNWINTYATTITEVLTGIGALLNTVLVLALRLATKKPRGGTWFAETLDESRIDLFYHTIAVMCVLNFIPVYALTSTCYYRKIKIREFLLLDGM